MAFFVVSGVIALVSLLPAVASTSLANSTIPLVDSLASAGAHYRGEDGKRRDPGSVISHR